MSNTDTYIDVVPVDDMFSDNLYQRELDTKRADHIAATWDRRLVGVLEVSDRGEHRSPRYAIINGQHRWAAASRAGVTALAATVHTGLSLADEAKLFYDIDAKTKALTTWDRWHARRGSGDTAVLEIEKIARQCGLTVTQGPGPHNLQCCAALERIWSRAASEVLADTLVLVLDIWPGEQDARKAVVLEGVALVLDTYSLTIDNGRLGDAMSEMTARQLLTRARDLQERGSGTLTKCVARILVTAYNKQARKGQLDPEAI
ncbi:DUF6551 family protein [Rhodococcus pyridinivorans]|uniref:DUF6551 family protein n=1 Tax=Rhodococcus pyridinivorans TaxID=103816 RepID=UPI003AAE562C